MVQFLTVSSHVTRAIRYDFLYRTILTKLKNLKFKPPNNTS